MSNFICFQNKTVHLFLDKQKENNWLKDKLKDNCGSYVDSGTNFVNFFLEPSVAGKFELKNTLV